MLKSTSMSRPWALAALACGLTVGVACTLANAATPFDVKVADYGFLAPVVAFAVVGALIAGRHPANSVGWLCLAIALLFGLVVAADAVANTRSLPLGLREWVGVLTAAWVPAFGLMATQLPL